MDTTEKTYFARRCDITGQGINTGYLWRHFGRITGTGEAAEQMARKLGFKDVQGAENERAAVFTVWADPNDVAYFEAHDGTLCTLDGKPAPPHIREDFADDFVRLVDTLLPEADAAILAQCLSYGVAVMRQRCELWPTADVERAHRIAEMYASRLAFELVKSSGK